MYILCLFNIGGGKYATFAISLQRETIKNAVMKTVRFFGMSLMAVVMGMNLTACSDDDEPNNNPGQNQGKLLESVVYPYNGSETLAKYEYDEKGRITAYKEGTETTSYTYLSDRIIEKNANGDEMTFYLNSKRLITKSTISYSSPFDDGTVGTYEYDNKGQIIKVTYDTWELKYTWANGNLISLDGGAGFFVINYTSIPSSKGQRVVSWILGEELDMMDDDDASTYAVLAPYGYFGKLPKNLIKSAATSGYAPEYTYAFGDDGYVSAMKINVSNKTFNYTFNWKR